MNAFELGLIPLLSWMFYLGFTMHPERDLSSKQTEAVLWFVVGWVWLAVCMNKSVDFTQCAGGSAFGVMAYILGEMAGKKMRKKQD